MSAIRSSLVSPHESACLSWELLGTAGASRPSTRLRFEAVILHIKTDVLDGRRGGRGGGAGGSSGGSGGDQRVVHRRRLKVPTYDRIVLHLVDKWRARHRSHRAPKTVGFVQPLLEHEHVGIRGYTLAHATDLGRVVLTHALSYARLRIEAIEDDNAPAVVELERRARRADGLEGHLDIGVSVVPRPCGTADVHGGRLCKPAVHTAPTLTNT